MAHLLDSLRKASTEKAQRLELARKRYVELIKKFVYQPESIDTKTQSEFHQAATDLGIDLGRIQQDIDRLQEVKRLEGIFALGQGLKASRFAAEDAIAQHNEKTREAMLRLGEERVALVRELGRLGDQYSNAMGAQAELENLKLSLGDLAGHIDIAELKD